VNVEVVDVTASTAGLEAELATVLVDCVEGGASVGFLSPLQHDAARQWWGGSLGGSGTVTFVARVDGPAIGVVQLKLSGMPNGAHRAEVAKLLVHREARGRGVATALLRALEAEALDRGRWLLTLDTETGSPAEQLYASRGWARVGVIAEYAGKPDGVLTSTTIMTKRLLAGGARALPR
jgi:GNAT superfamily N-acetyltransferase